MITLNERLQIIADQIEKGQTMADIGTDHGFLPLYLWESGICPKVIMTDISAASLDKAKEAFEGRPGCSVHFRLGDGLGPIDESEVDAVVIAGMGGVLMTHILGNDIPKTLSFGKYILQPRNGSGKLRYWLEQAGFEIVAEALGSEGKFICEILIVKPPKGVSILPTLDKYPDRIEYEIPRNLTEGSEILFNKYINKKIIIEKKIIKSMIDGKTRDIKKKNRSESRIKFLENIGGRSIDVF